MKRARGRGLGCWSRPRQRYLPQASPGDVADVVQGADLGLDFKLQLLVLDLDVSAT